MHTSTITPDIDASPFEGKCLIDSSFKNLLIELTKDSTNNKFLNKISKNIEIDFNKILKGTNFPINKFRLVGKINKGAFEKISAKSDFGENEHLDISLKRMENSTVYSYLFINPIISDFFNHAFFR